MHGWLERLAETNAHRRVAPVARRQPCARIRTIATTFCTSSTFLPASRDSSWPATPHHLLCTTSTRTTSVHPVVPAKRLKDEKTHQPPVRARRQQLPEGTLFLPRRAWTRQGHAIICSARNTTANILERRRTGDDSRSTKVWYGSSLTI